MAEIFKKAGPVLEQEGLVRSVRVLTDVSAGFWTVVTESEVEDLNAYLDMAQVVSENPKIGQALKGYSDLTTAGYREIFRIE